MLRHCTALVTLTAVACLTFVAQAQQETSSPVIGTLSLAQGVRLVHGGDAVLTCAEGAHQEAQSSKTKRNVKDDAEMIFIPAGSFLMGSTLADYKAESAALEANYGKQIVRDVLDKELSSELPQHRVTLSGYYIYKNLVTAGMYEKFCKETGRKMPPSPPYNKDWEKKDHPIVDVSWEDASAYCKWAGGKLPTEAQWEYAARGTDGRKYPWGNNFDFSKLRCSKKNLADAGGTAPVGSYPSGASPFGVLDMAGNVCQWCSDFYDASFYSNPKSKQANPENTTPEKDGLHIVRGGAWYDTPLIQGQTVPYADSNTDSGRVAYREGQSHDYSGGGLGFRCVLSTASP